MRWRMMASVTLGVIMALVVGCQQVAQPVPLAPTAQVTIPAATQTPTAETALERLRASVGKLDDAGSYQFAVQADHHLTLESQPTVWHYSGSGAYVSPDRIRWRLRGQADVMYDMVSVGESTRCADTRGLVTSGCSLLWGGPLPGASPCAVLTYLRNLESATTDGTELIDGQDCDYFLFKPDKSKIATSGQIQAEQMAKVVSVEGEAWVDRSTGYPRREKVRVTAISRTGQEQAMDVTIDFSEYGQPVDISLPN